MKERNTQLKTALGAMVNVETAKALASVPVEDTVNRCGNVAYSVDDELRLIAMLNTLKIEVLIIPISSLALLTDG